MRSAFRDLPLMQTPTPSPSTASARPPSGAKTEISTHSSINSLSIRKLYFRYFRDGWKLAEGFVASEGLDILPGLTKTRPNLVDTHRAVLAACFLNARLPEALVKVI